MDPLPLDEDQVEASPLGGDSLVYQNASGFCQALLTSGENASATTVLIPTDALNLVLQNAAKSSLEGRDARPQFVLPIAPSGSGLVENFSPDVATTYIEIQKISSETDEMSNEAADISPSKKLKKKGTPVNSKKKACSKPVESSKKKTPAKKAPMVAPSVDLSSQLSPGTVLTAKSLLTDDFPSKLSEGLADVVVSSSEISRHFPSLSSAPLSATTQSSVLSAPLLDSKDNIGVVVSSASYVQLSSKSMAHSCAGVVGGAKQAGPITVVAEGGIANIAALQAGIISLPHSLLQQAAARQGISLTPGSTQSLHLKLSPPAQLPPMPADSGDLLTPTSESLLQSAVPAESYTSSLLPSTASSLPSDASHVTPPTPRRARAMRSLLTKRTSAMRPILPKGGLEALNKLTAPPVSASCDNTNLNLLSFAASNATDDPPPLLEDPPPPEAFMGSPPFALETAMGVIREVGLERAEPVVKSLPVDDVIQEQPLEEPAPSAGLAEFDEMEAEDNMQRPHGEVFSKISVVIAEEILAAIPNSKTSFLSALATQFKSQLRAVPEKNIFSLHCQSFADLCGIQEVLRKLFRSGDAKTAEESPEVGSVASVPEESIVKEEEVEVVEVMRPRKRGRPRKSQTVREEPKAPVEDTREPRFSRSGRRLKLKCLDGGGSEGEEQVEEKEELPVRRKVGRPRKVCEGGEEEVLKEVHPEQDAVPEALEGGAEKENAAMYEVEEGGPSPARLGHRYVKKKNYEAASSFKFFCKLCSFKTKRQSHYRNHLRLHETARTLFKCGRCPFTTLRLNHLRRHERSHKSTSTQMANQPHLRCTRCPHRATSAAALARHFRSKHATPGGPGGAVFKCKNCDYRTDRQHLIVRHLRVHTIQEGAEGVGQYVNRTVRTYKCEQCTYATGRKENFLRHAANAHSGCQPFLCDTCGKRFKRQDNLRVHALVHLDKAQRPFPYKCYVCQKGLRSRAHLREHLTTHSSARTYLCEICGASFKTQSVQRKHVQSIHQNPHAFVCSRCPKTFNTKYSLLRHEKTHRQPAPPPEAPLLLPGTQEVIVPQLSAEEMQSIQIDYATGDVIAHALVPQQPTPHIVVDGNIVAHGNMAVSTDDAKVLGNILEGEKDSFEQVEETLPTADGAYAAGQEGATLFYLNPAAL